MRRSIRRKCKHCKVFFSPDPRVGERQQYCSKSGCRQASKMASQRRWQAKPENRDYFRGPAHVQRVQRWRKAHPHYWRRPPAQTGFALQDERTAQATDINGKSGIQVKAALQEMILAKPYVLIGLLSNLLGSALQDEISVFVYRLHTLGLDIVNPPPDSTTDDSQTITRPNPVPARAPPVQLDRSTPGPR